MHADDRSCLSCYPVHFSAPVAPKLGRLAAVHFGAEAAGGDPFPGPGAGPDGGSAVVGGTSRGTPGRATVPGLPGLSGATLRIFYSFMVPIFGGRFWTTLTTWSLLAPALGILNAMPIYRSEWSGMGTTSRPAITWRVLFLSTGEMRLADVMAQAGQRPQAGQEVRLVDLPADAGAGMGAFECLHNAATPAALAEMLDGAVRAEHGTAGPAFLEWLQPCWAADPDWPAAALIYRMQDFLAEALPPGADAQVRTVARRFAVVAIGGELATQAGVTELVLRGIFLLRRAEIDWFYQRGASALFPDAWEGYLAPIPEAERGDLLRQGQAGDPAQAGAGCGRCEAAVHR
mgnify:CR=1 FL=1